MDAAQVQRFQLGHCGEARQTLVAYSLRAIEVEAGELLDPGKARQTRIGHLAIGTDSGDTSVFNQVRQLVPVALIDSRTKLDPVLFPVDFVEQPCPPHAWPGTARVGERSGEVFPAIEAVLPCHNLAGIVDRPVPALPGTSRVGQPTDDAKVQLFVVIRGAGELAQAFESSTVVAGTRQDLTGDLLELPHASWVLSQRMHQSRPAFIAQFTGQCELLRGQRSAGLADAPSLEAFLGLLAQLF